MVLILLIQDACLRDAVCVFVPTELVALDDLTTANTQSISFPRSHFDFSKSSTRQNNIRAFWLADACILLFLKTKSWLTQWHSDISNLTIRIVNGKAVSFFIIRLDILLLLLVANPDERKGQENKVNVWDITRY